GRGFEGTAHAARSFGGAVLVSAGRQDAGDGGGDYKGHRAGGPRGEALAALLRRQPSAVCLLRLWRGDLADRSAGGVNGGKHSQRLDAQTSAEHVIPATAGIQNP